VALRSPGRQLPLGLGARTIRAGRDPVVYTRDALLEGVVIAPTNRHDRLLAARVVGTNLSPLEALNSAGVFPQAYRCSRGDAEPHCPPRDVADDLLLLGRDGGQPGGELRRGRGGEGVLLGDQRTAERMH
jgi:hypothetical protein